MIFKLKRHRDSTMVVSLLALENELSKCEKELRMLGSDNGSERSSLFVDYLDNIVGFLIKIRDGIPFDEIYLKVAVRLLHNSINNAVLIIHGNDIRSDRGWMKNLNAVNSVSIFAHGLEPLDSLVTNFREIRKKIHETLRVDFTTALPIAAEGREAFIREKLKTLGTELGTLGANGNFYNFLGDISKVHMLDLIEYLKK
jgi:hypothetical protein